uniref:Uncharacterized protein n=1 Tax=Ascaris lumbricoides TaxID=6252 RepID=A0A0M3I2Y2_ASCLU
MDDAACIYKIQLFALAQISRLENNVERMDCTRVTAHRMLAKTASTETTKLRASRAITKNRPPANTDPGLAMRDHIWENSKSAEMRKIDNFMYLPSVCAAAQQGTAMH